MSLSSAINTAQSLLGNTAKQTSVVSNNITNATNPNHVRRTATLGTTEYGSQIVRIDRAQNEVLFRNQMTALADASGQSTLLAGLEQFKVLVGGNDFERSPSRLIGDLRDTLQAFAAKPSEQTLADTAVANAGELAAMLRTSSSATQTLRREADAAIAEDVDRLNTILARFEIVNNDVVSGTAIDKDVSAELDERDTLLREISEMVGITTVTRSNNDLVLYTEAGVTLFETLPRPVEFVPTTTFDATVTGNTVVVDGVALLAGIGGNTSAKGSLAANLQLRDDIAPTYQSQLDEIARGLITLFEDSELFVWTPGGILPPGTVEPNLAATIEVNTALDPALGGNPMVLRDGVGGASNPAGDSGFSDLINQYLADFETDMAFDGSTALAPSQNLIAYASSSIGWLEALRSGANEANEKKSAYSARITEALSNEAGVNIDEELALLLQLEQSYAASARIITAVDEMLRNLLAVGR